MSQPLGFELHRDRTRIVIATLHSDNRKTGDMVQVWILRRDMLPTEAIARGLDSAICGDCKHRGVFNPATGKHGSARTCYVNVGQAPQQVYRTWQRGQYPRLKLAGYAQAFAGRSIRLGAYGDPVHIPLAMVAELARVTTAHTGYTHQWKDAELAGYKGYVMASCDTEAEYNLARWAGWRTFRVAADLAALPGEILCPSSNEAGNRTTCEACHLCDGARTAGMLGKADNRRNIFIPVHGSGASNFVVLQ